MLRNLLLPVSLGLFSAVASAQCAALSVTGSGAPGTSLTVAIDGTAVGAFAWIAVGETQGSTPINLGTLGSFTLGLAAPFSPVPVGMTNASGDASLVINVPATLPASLSLFAQGVTFGFSFTPGGPGGPPSFGLSICTTNVVGFTVGS